MFKEVKKKNKFEEVLDQIKELLLRKQLKIGQKLPNEIELSEKLGISRASLREAYTVLRTLGIIEGRSGEGTVIKKAQPENLSSIMSLVAVSNEMKMDDLFDTRIILERAVSRLAAVNRTEEDLLEIHHILSQATESYDNKDKEKQANFDFLFHKSLVSSTKNKVLVMLVEIISGLLNEQIEATRSKLSTSPEVLERFHHEHYSIYEAIKEKNADKAEQLMEEHLRNSQIELGIIANKL